MVSHIANESCESRLQVKLPHSPKSGIITKKNKINAIPPGNFNGISKYFVQKHSSMFEQLSYVAFPIELKIFEEFREFVFESIKGIDTVQTVAEHVTIDNIQGVLHYFLNAKREVIQILWEKLLKHKWGDVAVILKSYAYVDWNDWFSNHSSKKTFQPALFFNVGREVLCNHPLAAHDTNVHLLLNRCFDFFGISLDASTTAIEDGFFHLARFDFDTAKESLLRYDYMDKGVVTKELRRQRALCHKNTADLYIGIVNYCKWRKALLLESSNSLQPVTGTSDPGQSFEIAESMIKCFEDLWTAEGVWDIAMMKNYEVLLHCHKFEILQQNLLDYSQKHKKNPNAHRYFYAFLKSHSKPDDEKFRVLKLKTLKRLHKIAPTDFFMIDYHLLRADKAAIPTTNGKKKRKRHFKTFNVIMNMLDRPSMLTSVEPWCEFYQQLSAAKDVVSKSCFSRIVERLWKISGRTSWWPRFHFTHAQALKTASHSNHHFVRAKLFVASTFMGPDNQFCKTIEQYIPSAANENETDFRMSALS